MNIASLASISRITGLNLEPVVWRFGMLYQNGIEKLQDFNMVINNETKYLAKTVLFKTGPQSTTSCTHFKLFSVNIEQNNGKGPNISLQQCTLCWVSVTSGQLFSSQVSVLTFSGLGLCHSFSKISRKASTAKNVKSKIDILIYK